MNVIRGLSALLGVACLLFGSLLTGRNESAFGQSLIIAGAIIIAGALISFAIIERGRRG